MKIPAEFDCIRPFEPEELPEVYDRLLSDPQFQKVLAYLYPGVPLDNIAAKMRACKTLSRAWVVTWMPITSTSRTATLS